MKVSSVLTGAALALGVSGFADTASFYSSHEFGSFKYIEQASDVAHALEAYSDTICSLGGKLVIYRAKNVHMSVDQAVNTIKHVHYDNSDALDLSLGQSCSVKYVEGMEASNTDENVLIRDVDSEELALDVNELMSSGKHVIVQQIPSFEGASKLKAFKEYIGEQYEHLKGHQHAKKAQDSEEEYLQAVSELEDDLRAAESFIAHEGDSLVTALASPKASSTAAPVADAPKKITNANLFTTYQFFTPGILSCAIVSFALIGILYGALRWISALEISYHAFEKQVDYEKKNE
ncbi:uncharacterized protein CANTADRAFT_88286 [Suhomyces tanzawaensis NRRL Y-17324]|uniref:Protein BIG1 n=1 Tax=Suhomyces tanzawaensis NRRL Y-17324 TaxID=984487 RepID=A0A1E4SS90_9ASCO|nr:uncharacterized protein CANTADRAFT_88286 [Suhomyces tanzawaensis NRRL Y-17324]ODV82383.1 hypothetical protein CANTADRAFT_88286 [Suhomyces tanzawaensis NRRL Y-17324]